MKKVYICALALASSLLVGCFGFGRKTPKLPDTGHYIPDNPGSAAGPFEQLAYYGSWLAGVGMLVAIFMIWFKPKEAPRVAFISLSVLAGAQAMIWISNHLGLITIVLLLGGALYAIIKNRETIKDEIEDLIDGEDTEKYTKDTSDEQLH